MLKIASAFVVGMIGFLMFSLVPREVAHQVVLAVDRNVEIQMEHFRRLGR